MSDPRTEHPASERLVAFADGMVTDTRDIEAHLDVCEECAKAVFIARQVACMAEQDLIPGLSPAERIREKERLRDLFKRQPLERSATDLSLGPKDSMPTARPGNAKWISLGALAGALGFGHASFGPKPVLAGSEPAAPSDSPHPPGATDTDSHDSEHPGVMPDDDAASHHHDAKLPRPDEMAEFLEQIQELLGANLSDAHDSDHSIHCDQGSPIDSDSGSEHDSATEPTASDDGGHAGLSDSTDHSPDASHDDQSGHDHADDHSLHEDAQQDDLDHDGGIHHD